MEPTVEVGKTISDRFHELMEEDPGLEESTGSLKVNKFRLSRCDLLSTIHKGLSTVKGSPVSCNCGSIAEHISEYLDHRLNLLVSFTRSYVKDTNHFLARLGKLRSMLDGALLCSVDVVGLFPKIFDGEGFEAMREARSRRVNPTVATDTLVGIASLVLRNNYL